MISVIVNFYNMQREAARTLYTLSTAYQRDIAREDYEVIVIDNGSTQPLDRNTLEQLDCNISYHFFDADTPSPAAALNNAVNQAQGDYVMCCIDGARMLSPSILSLAKRAATISDNPFIYTLGMHLGAKVQNLLVEEGYNQQVEDKLLQTINWRADGYRLFGISSFAASCRYGYYSALRESNCFMMKRSQYQAMKGFDERFTSAGGGLVNLDFFKRCHANALLEPIMLLGEATFHQFHGGVATNVARSEHPWEKMEAEYQSIHGQLFSMDYRKPLYIGRMSDECVQACKKL
jgi:glycosyltransferase involved in cell wall biosynthesis